MYKVLDKNTAVPIFATPRTPAAERETFVRTHPQMLVPLRFFSAGYGPAVSTAKFDMNRCNDSPQRGEKPD